MEGEISRTGRLGTDDRPRPRLSLRLPDELTTARLRLRRWREDDAPLMAAINRDPEVTRYLNRPVDAAAVADFHRVVTDHWSQHGFGFYAVDDLRGAARFVGFVGIAHPAFLPELAHRPELGWRLARDCWGAGLATEAAVAVRDRAFAAQGLAELISIVHPDNARSRRLAEKLGMAVQSQVRNPILDLDVDVWQLSAPSRPDNVAGR